MAAQKVLLNFLSAVYPLPALASTAVPAPLVPPLVSTCPPFSGTSSKACPSVTSCSAVVISATWTGRCSPRAYSVMRRRWATTCESVAERYSGYW